MSFPSSVLFALRRALPVFLALGVVLTVDAVLDGWVVVAVAAVAVVALIVFYERAKSRPAYGPLERVPERAGNIAWWIALLVTMAAYIGSDYDGKVLGVTMAVASVISLTGLVWWFNRVPAGTST